MIRESISPYGSYSPLSAAKVLILPTSRQEGKVLTTWEPRLLSGGEGKLYLLLTHKILARDKQTVMNS